MQPEVWANEINASWQRSRVRPAVVLCAAFSGLAVIRSLGRRGIPVFAVDSRPLEVGMQSRYALPLTLPSPAAHSRVWIDFLLDAGRKLDCRPVVFAAGDPHLSLLSEARAALAGFYEFSIPNSDVLDLLSDKRCQYRYLAEQGVAIPDTRMPQSAEEAMHDAGAIGFPCLAKPAVSHLWTAISDSKLTVIRDAQQAADGYRAMTAAGAGFLLQEFIEGGDDQFYGFLGYFDRAGVARAGMTKRKLRQFPETFGNGCLQISVNDPEMALAATQMFEKLAYKGLGTVEYKLDPRDHKRKLIEINPRSVSGLQLAIDSGCDLPWVAYCDLTGMPVESSPRQRSGVLFVNEAWELQRIWRNGSRSPAAWMRGIASILRARSFATLNWRDPGPAFSFAKRAWLLRTAKDPATSILPASLAPDAQRSRAVGD